MTEQTTTEFLAPSLRRLAAITKPCWLIGFFLVIQSVIFLPAHAQSPSVELDRSAWSVSASPGSNAENAIDDAISTRWTTQTPQRAGQTFTLDLGASQNIDRIVMVTNNNQSNNQDYPRGYEVHVSDDAQNWGVAVAVGQGSATHTTEISFSSQSARYIRFTQTGSAQRNWWSIHDLKMYGTAGNTEPTADSVTLERDVWTVSASNNTGDANNAIDDSVASRWTTRQNQQPDQTFILDLGSSKVVDRISMLTNNNNSFNQDYPRSFEVHLSADGESWGESVASGQGSVSATTDISFTEQPAQFLRITQTGGDAFYWWSIHDLNVYGTDNNTPGNVAPTASFVAPTPANGETLDLNSDLNVTVEASDNDGIVDNVVLYINDQSVGQINQPPYEWGSQLDAQLNNLPEGNYQLRAQATDNSGAVTAVVTGFLLEASDTNNDGLHPDIVKVLDTPLSEILRVPGGRGWADSYSVGDQCYCETTYDHDIGPVIVDTPNGSMTVRQVCDLIGPGPGSDGRPLYNDVQCGNGPANNAGDEDWCPGRTDLEGTDDEKKLGCNQVGPTWKF